jgi:SAM-dependent methyltransferase
MDRVNRVANLILKGLRHPGKVKPYILETVYPSKFKNKTVEDGVVTWNTKAGYQWGDGETPPQISAINYHIVQALRSDLQDNNYRHAVEIGCGYGRVTPWLSEFASDVTGVDPNEAVLSVIEEYYPFVDTVAAKAQELPMGSGTADLIFTRGVLQHVPETEIEPAATEIKRIASDDAHFLLCEDTTGEETSTYHPRSLDRYADLFEPYSLENHWNRESPAKSREHNRSRMLFTGE